jgi:hypothetical protein
MTLDWTKCAEGFVPIFSSRRRRQSQNVLCFDFAEDSFKRTAQRW